ncbi:MAG: EAL domain-containing protein [Gammaproteobacteria bacterium]|nr:EAL domain-containing protein [Gammaproteobacteria bacterium]
MPRSPEKRQGLILVADDDATQRLLTRQTLEQANFEVVEAPNGEVALQVYEQHRPDLILLDVRMPKMDGFTVCARIREMVDGAEVPIVMVTGLEDIESLERSYQFGATDFITKPVVWETLSHRVRYLQRAGNAIRALRQSELRLVQAQQVARMGNWDWDIVHDQVNWSDEIFHLFPIGRGVLDASFQSFLSFVHPDDRLRVNTAIDDALANKAPYLVEHRIVGEDGREVSVEQQAEVVFGDNETPLRMIGTVQDVSDRKRTERKIHQLAYFDALTGLPNREHFRKQTERALRGAKRNGHRLALIFLDLDDFKYINDTLGHDAGDELLCKIADYLQHSIRASDVVAKLGAEDACQASLSRLGGDEFTILLPDLQEIEAAAKVAERILEQLQNPIKIQGKEFFVTGSMGIALYPNDGESVDLLLKNADIAMYHAKQNGRNSYRFYTAHMEERVQLRLSIESKLKQTLEKEELDLHYQAKVEIGTGRIVGVEALLRWHNPEMGQVSPARFIPVAEETGLIVPIGEWVLNTACQHAKTWRQRGLVPGNVAVNLSSHQFRRGGLVEKVSQALASTGWDAQWLELELTESVIMENAEETIHVLNQLKEMGITLSVDDFGTGYSSMAYLKRFPLDVVKIDQSFVNDITTDASDATIVKAIIGLARGLNLTSIAEGVETEQQLNFLRQNGCDQVQGYLINRPVPAEQMEQLLRAEQSSDEKRPLPMLKPELKRANNR